MVIHSNTSTLKPGPIAESATHAAGVAQGKLSEATEGESFFLCGCDSDRTTLSHRLADGAEEGGHGVMRLVTKVTQAVMEAVHTVLLVARDGDGARCRESKIAGRLATSRNARTKWHVNAQP